MLRVKAPVGKSLPVQQFYGFQQFPHSHVTLTTTPGVSVLYLLANDPSARVASSNGFNETRDTYDSVNAQVREVGFTALAVRYVLV
jgi:hypothetical protein